MNVFTQGLVTDVPVGSANSWAPVPTIVCFRLETSAQFCEYSLYSIYVVSVALPPTWPSLKTLTLIILTVLVYCCINGTTPRYLASELQRVADIESRGRLRSSSTALLHVPRSLHKTIGDRAFPVPAARVWNMLQPAITSSPSLQTFKRASKSELFRRSYDNAH